MSHFEIVTESEQRPSSHQISRRLKSCCILQHLRGRVN